MTDDAAGPSVKVDVGLGARAEARLELKAEVPQAAAGRFVDAITDMFRPFSEARGLRADQIRLQREEVLVEVARLARQRIALEKAEVEAVPLRILVPLLEKASCEEVGDDLMQRRWADLLASAATRKGAHPRYVQVLSELGRDEVLLLDEMCLSAAADWQLPSRIFSDLETEMDAHGGFRQMFELISGLGFDDEEEVIDLVRDVVERPGCVLIHALLRRRDGGLSSGGGGGDPGRDRALRVCESLGLLRRVEERLALDAFDGVACAISYGFLTRLGQELVTLSNPDVVTSLAEMEGRNGAIAPDNVSEEGYRVNWRIRYASPMSNVLFGL